MLCAGCQLKNIDPRRPPFGGYMCTNVHMQCSLCEKRYSGSCTVCNSGTYFVKMSVEMNENGNCSDAVKRKRTVSFSDEVTKGLEWANEGDAKVGKQTMQSQNQSDQKNKSIDGLCDGLANKDVDGIVTTSAKTRLTAEQPYEGQFLEQQGETMTTRTRKEETISKIEEGARMGSFKDGRKAKQSHIPVLLPRQGICRKLCTNVQYQPLKSQVHVLETIGVKKLCFKEGGRRELQQPKSLAIRKPLRKAQPTKEDVEEPITIPLSISKQVPLPEIMLAKVPVIKTSTLSVGRPAALGAANLLEPVPVTELEPVIETERESVPATETETETEPATATETEPVLEPEPEPISVTQPEPLPEPEPEQVPATETEPEPEPVPATETQPEPVPVTETEPVPELKPEPVTEPKPEPVTEPKPEPVPEPKPLSKIVTVAMDKLQSQMYEALEEIESQLLQDIQKMKLLNDASDLKSVDDMFGQYSESKYFSVGDSEPQNSGRADSDIRYFKQKSLEYKNFCLINECTDTSWMPKPDKDKPDTPKTQTNTAAIWKTGGSPLMERPQEDTESEIESSGDWSSNSLGEMFSHSETTLDDVEIPQLMAALQNPHLSNKQPNFQQLECEFFQNYFNPSGNFKKCEQCECEKDRMRVGQYKETENLRMASTTSSNSDVTVMSNSSSGKFKDTTESEEETEATEATEATEVTEISENSEELELSEDSELSMRSQQTTTYPGTCTSLESSLSLESDLSLLGSSILNTTSTSNSTSSITSRTSGSTTPSTTNSSCMVMLEAYRDLETSKRSHTPSNLNFSKRMDKNFISDSHKLSKPCVAVKSDHDDKVDLNRLSLKTTPKDSKLQQITRNEGEDATRAINVQISFDRKFDNRTELPQSGNKADFPICLLVNADVKSREELVAMKKESLDRKPPISKKEFDGVPGTSKQSLHNAPKRNPNNYRCCSHFIDAPSSLLGRKSTAKPINCNCGSYIEQKERSTIGPYNKSRDLKASHIPNTRISMHPSNVETIEGTPSSSLHTNAVILPKTIPPATTTCMPNLQRHHLPPTSNHAMKWPISTLSSSRLLNKRETPVHLARNMKFLRENFAMIVPLFVNTCYAVHCPLVVASPTDNPNEILQQFLLMNCSQNKMLELIRRKANSIDLNRMPINALQISRLPLICPQIACKRLSFVSDFCKHLVIQHADIPIVYTTRHSYRNFTIDSKLPPIGECQCHLGCFVKDLITGLGSSAYKDCLPLMVMTARLTTTDLYNLPSTQNPKLQRNKDFLLIWVTGLIPDNVSLKITFAVFQPFSRKPKLHIVRSGEVYSIRNPQNALSVLHNASTILLSYMDVEKLSNHGKQMIQAQLCVN